MCIRCSQVVLIRVPSGPIAGPVHRFRGTASPPPLRFLHNLIPSGALTAHFYFRMIYVYYYYYYCRFLSRQKLSVFLCL